MRKLYVALAKWLWVGCVVVAAGAVVWRSRDDVLRMFSQIPLWLMAVSFLLLVAAKLLLGENARIAAAHSGIALDYGTATRLYNLSQLGKYLPGSVWQFIGRAAAYRTHGAGYAQIRDALLTESLWIVAAAFCIGGLLCGPALVSIVHDSLSSIVAWWLLALAAIGTLGVAGLLVWKRAAFMRYIRSAVPTSRAVLVQTAIWCFLGGSFWVLIQACDMDAGLVFSIGLFAAAYAVGFLVPIAPAGLGVRDGILTLGLLPFAPAGEAVAVTVVARLIYLVVELVLVAIQEPIARLFEKRRCDSHSDA